jgi:hypothetical protein
MPKTVSYDYTPHPGPQTLAHHTLVDELLYGGAAGGGKSRMARAEAVLNCLRVPGFRAIIFRSTFKDLERAVVEPLLQEIPAGLGRYNASNHIFKFFNGSILELGYLRRQADTNNYQGAEYQLIVFEEATHFTFKMFDFMRTRARAGGPVADAMDAVGLRPRMILTANPGGIGHHWVKREFIDAAPSGKVWRPRPSKDEPNPPTRCYIPAKATDNPSLDAGYMNKLNALEPNLRRAMRDGDWEVLDGVRFPGFSRNIHVIEPEQLPIPHVGYPRGVGIDYGNSAPFAALWGAKLPDNLVVVYRELYKPGLTPRQQAELVRDSEAPGERMPERPISLVLDKSMWARSTNNPLAVRGTDGSPPPGSIADAYWKVFGSQIGPSNSDRIGGWALVEEQLRVRDDGLPRLLIYSTCTNLIRTLPALPRDTVNPDDVNTKAEDHAADALRYLLMDLIGKAPVGAFSAQAWADGRRNTTMTGDLSSVRL